MTVSKAQLKEFEAVLDAALAQRRMNGFNSNQALLAAANVAETAAARSPMDEGASWLNRGIVSFAPHLVSGRTGREPVLEEIVADLMFGSHYYLLRELIYYSYNAPNSIDWKFAGRRIEIRYQDRSIPRQFFTTWNDYMLGSMHHFKGFEAPDEIRRLLKGVEEWRITDAHRAAWPLLEAEADHKLAAYFSILNPQADIGLGGYSYREFMTVYRSLLVKALYHRYHAELNGVHGCVYVTTEELEVGLKEDQGIDAEITRRILADIVYDNTAVAGRLDASYFSLYREGAPPHRIIMRPFHFSIQEGLVMLLRVVAQRRPKVFLSNISNELGARFVERAKQAFESQGFVSHANLSLRTIDVSLPDIDLLVISEEPTLGYVLLVCEVKAPIPPVWAKDQLRVLEPDSVSKAYRQVEAIQTFLKKKDGVKFLRSLLPADGIPHFDGFVAVVKHLIITSDSAGMFFEHEETEAMCFRTLERLLRRSDGDMALILECIGTYSDRAGAAVQTAMVEVQLNQLTVSYEAVRGCELMDFPQGKWRSSPARQEMIDSFIASGAHPFDSLKDEEVVSSDVDDAPRK